MYKVKPKENRFKNSIILKNIAFVFFDPPVKRKPYVLHGLLTKSTNLVETTPKDYRI